MRTFWRRNQSIVAFGQDALEQQRQLGGRPVGVFLGQPDHRVLDDVERRVVVAHGVDGALEGPLLDALEEVGEFFFGRQAKSAPGRLVGGSAHRRLFWAPRDYRIGCRSGPAGSAACVADAIMRLARQ